MIKKEILATLSMGYCIDLVNWNGRQYCITASEERNGQVLLIDTETNKVQRIVGLSGGCMSILPNPEEPIAYAQLVPSTRKVTYPPEFPSTADGIIHLIFTGSTVFSRTFIFILDETL